MEEEEVWRKERYDKEELSGMIRYGQLEERYGGRGGKEEGEVLRKERYGGRRGMKKGEVLRKEKYGGRRGMEEGEVWRKER